MAQNTALSLPVSHHDLLLSHFRAAHDVLLVEQDLSPRNPKINSCLSAFVAAVLDCHCHDTCDLLAMPEVVSKRDAILPKLAQAEYEMEKFFALDFAAQDVLTDADLDHFIYRDNYVELVAEEIDAARTANVLPDDRPVVFVGAGPLPFSAIDMHKQTGLKMICIDSDADAVALSRKMIAALGMQDAIDVVQASGEDFDYSGAGLVMVAALVSAKDNVLARVRDTAPGVALAVRSAEGVRTLLYEQADERAMDRAGYDYAGKSRITDTIINTTLFFQPRPV